MSDATSVLVMDGMVLALQTPVKGMKGLLINGNYFVPFLTDTIQISDSLSLTDSGSMSQSLSQSSSSGIDINEFPYTICISETQINNFSAQLTIVDPSATGKARVWATEGQQGQVNYFRLSNPYGTQWQLDTYYCTYYGGTQDDPWVTTLWDTQPFGQATVSIFDCSSVGGVSDSQVPQVSDSISSSMSTSSSQASMCVDLFDYVTEQEMQNLYVKGLYTPVSSVGIADINSYQGQHTASDGTITTSTATIGQRIAKGNTDGSECLSGQCQVAITITIPGLTNPITQTQTTDCPSLCLSGYNGSIFNGQGEVILTLQDYQQPIQQQVYLNNLEGIACKAAQSDSCRILVSASFLNPDAEWTFRTSSESGASNVETFTGDCGVGMQLDFTEALECTDSNTLDIVNKLRVLVGLQPFVFSDSASVTFDVQFGSSDSQFQGCVDLTNLLMGTYYGHDVSTMPSFKDLVGYIHFRSCDVAIKYGIQVPDDTRTPKVSISGYTMALKDVTPSTTVSTYGSSSDSSVDELYCNTTQYCLSESGCHLSASRDVQRTATTTWSHDGSTQTNTAKVTRQVSVDKLSFKFGHNPNEYMQFQLGGTPAKITGKSLASAVLSDGVYMQSPISTGVIYGLQASNWMLSQSDSKILVTYIQDKWFSGVLYYWLTQTDPDLTATTYRDVNISYTQTTKLFLDIDTIPEQPKILNFINLVRKELGLSPLQKSDSESGSYNQQTTAQAYAIQ